MTEELTKEQLEKKNSKWNTVRIASLTSAAAFIIGGTVPMACDTYSSSILDQYDNLQEQFEATGRLIDQNAAKFGDLYHASLDNKNLRDLDIRMSKLEKTESYREAMQGKKAEKDTKATYGLLGLLFTVSSLGVGIGASARKEHYENRLMRVNVRNKRDVA